jgi:hypothetical protein
MLHSTINRLTVKVSYRCLPSMGAQVAKHNAKLLSTAKTKGKRMSPSCNCQKSKIHENPIPGACNTDRAVYQAIVRNNKGEEECYEGLAKSFKKTYNKNKATINEYKPEGNTTLSTHYLKKREAGGNHTIQWKILEQNIPN